MSQKRPLVGRLRGDRVVRVDPNDPIAVSKARSAIADRYDEHARRRAEDRIPFEALLRIHELEQYLTIAMGSLAG